jgi:hypothetical protein
VQDWPELSGIDRCKVLVLASPTPFSYTGTTRKHGAERRIRLFEEKMAENRQETRYKTNIDGYVENLVYDGKEYALHTRVKVRIINISKSGLRVEADDYTFYENTLFNIHLKIGENDKTLTGKVMNTRVMAERAEYGCRLANKDGDTY